MTSRLLRSTPLYGTAVDVLNDIDTENEILYLVFAVLFIGILIYIWIYWGKSDLNDNQFSNNQFINTSNNEDTPWIEYLLYGALILSLVSPIAVNLWQKNGDPKMERIDNMKLECTCTKIK